ncbi:endonuclease domain-containing 1 protein-like [Alosa sapidissima]|uniref:endonuclease domain-containing 1 protein-like n=1 Tax=Alosa sapidissima TaxID=34773 RepID=UPI001C08C478|nr:endonuclease domain-containing 1 protein-like [Alosa sapidissima]
MKLVGQAVLIILVNSVAVGLGAVVTNFSQNCSQFFSNPNGVVTPPDVFPGPQYRQICQKQANQNFYEFATLYDSVNRIPVFSAYEYVGHKPCTRKDVWYFEPQLDDQNKGPSMAPESTVSKAMRGNNQALGSDYEKSGYDKGHLYPVFHTNSQSCADSTFTLTNAAPQQPSFNRGEWKKMENDLVKFLNQNCLPNQAYVVTGVVPSTNPPVFVPSGRVNVPTHFWNAYCCLDNNLRPMFSGGYLSTNDKQKGQSFNTTSALEQVLSNLYPSPFHVFGGKC